MSTPVANGLGILAGVVLGLFLAGAAELNIGFGIGFAVILAWIFAAGLRPLARQEGDDERTPDR